MCEPRIRDICLGDSLDEAAARWPEEVGWIFEDEPVTFSQMKERAETVARALLAHGIGPGDRVALWMGNRPEFAYSLMACGKIGAIAVPINTRSRSFELQHTLRHSRAKLLLRARSLLRMNFSQILREAGATDISEDGKPGAGPFPSLQLVVSIEADREPEALTWANFIKASEFIDQSSLAGAQRSVVVADPVLLQYTSGTTAAPKGALCSHRYISNFGVDTVRRLGVRAREAILNTQPFYHTGGSCGALCAPLTLGHRAVIPEYYDAKRVLELIERERCVARSGFGAMYVMELAHPDFGKYDLSSLRAAWCIAPIEVMQRVQREMRIPVVVQIYGATEGGGAAGGIDDAPEKRLVTCGRAMAGTEIAIFDPESGQPRGTGAAGEIAVRGWYTMNGYLDEPDETAAVFDANGWLHTGDLGSLDGDGYLTFLGRIKNMMKVGGENVSAEEVEAILMRHEKVAACAVISTPDPRLDEVVMAVVELRPGAQATEEEIIAFCARQTANFRVPRHVRFVTEWPLTGSGKIQRHVLSSQFVGPNFAAGIQSQTRASS